MQQSSRHSSVSDTSMFASQKSAVDDSKRGGNDLCLVCNELVKTSDNGLQCDMCHEWCHANCAGIDKTSYRALCKVATARWFCKPCDPKVDQLLQVQQRVELLEVNYKKLQEHILLLCGKNEESHGAPPPPLFNGAFLPRLIPPMQFQSSQSSSSRPTPTNSGREALFDEFERQHKQNNAVLFGLDDSDENETVVVKRMVEAAHIDDLKAKDIVTVFRNGPTVAGKPRLCKVYCSSIKAKVAFVKFINESRKSGDDNFKNLRARFDLTYLQREMGRKLRAELETRLSKGESNLYIDYKRGCVVSKRVI